jgi:hypothetical protein
MIVEGVAERNSSSGIGEGDFAGAAAVRRVDLVEVGVERVGFLLGDPVVDARDAVRVEVRVRTAAAALAGIGGDDGGAAAVDRVLVRVALVAPPFVAAAAFFVVDVSAATGACFLGRKGRGIAVLSKLLLAGFGRCCFESEGSCVMLLFGRGGFPVWVMTRLDANG